MPKILNPPNSFAVAGRQRVSRGEVRVRVSYVVMDRASRSIVRSGPSARLAKLRHMRHSRHTGGGSTGRGSGAPAAAATLGATHEREGHTGSPQAVHQGREEPRQRESDRRTAHDDGGAPHDGGAASVDDDIARPWCPLRATSVLLLQLPTALHEVPGSQLHLQNPALRWRLSLWQSPQHRLCDDAIVPLTVVPGANPTRVLRFDVPGDVGVVTLRLEVVDGTSSVAYGSLYLHLRTLRAGGGGGAGDGDADAGAGSPTRAGTGASPAAPVPQVGDNTFHLTPLSTASIPAAMFNSHSDEPQLLAPFAATLVCTREPLRLPAVPTVPRLSLVPEDMLLPGRNDVYVSVSHVMDTMATPEPGSQFTLLLVLSHGNGDLAIGPQVLGSACVDQSGAWFGDWQRMVRLTIPTELCQAPSGTTDLHVLFYLLTTHAAPEAETEDGPVAVLPVVSAFAYLMLQRRPNLFVDSGQRYLRVYKGSPPFLPCVADGTPLFCASPCEDRVVPDTTSGSVPPHLQLLVPTAHAEVDEGDSDDDDGLVDTCVLVLVAVLVLCVERVGRSLRWAGTHGGTSPSHDCAGTRRR